MQAGILEAKIKSLMRSMLKFVTRWTRPKENKLYSMS